ncbi:MAG: acetyltransferase [Candidatus Pacebacteria bacterium]|jgi:UDP-2-acetamido-3-amino-2,3-dideoxy-glucuronate N-acetyltransferase|nr:acetyltransferase [Candidatus Paceibacterota bacterium]
MPITIHSTAEVSPKAVIGDGTKIWHNAQVLEGAVIGENCVIGHNCLVGEVTVGNGVKIQSNTDVWHKVTLEDYVFVGPSAVFTNDLNPRAKYPKTKEEWLPTLVKEGATLGANSTVVCGSTIGKWALIGAGAVVKGQVPDHALMVGVPAKQIGWVCECGIKLEFVSGSGGQEAGSCSACGRKYTKKGQEVGLA